MRETSGEKPEARGPLAQKPGDVSPAPLSARSATGHTMLGLNGTAKAHTTPGDLYIVYIYRW